MPSCSLDNALLLLNKWKDEGSPVKTVLYCPDMLSGLSFGGLVKVEEVDENDLKLEIGPSAAMSLCLKNCKFEYAEPRDLGGTIRRVAEPSIEYSLSLMFPFGLFVTFIQAKDEQGT